MKRRSFLSETSAALATLGLSQLAYKKRTPQPTQGTLKSCITLDQEKVFFYAEAIKEPLKVVHIADTHLFRDDERGLPYQQYSNRMARAYNQSTHFKSGAKTHPEEAFEQALAFAKEVEADLLTLVGDIFSFPSNAVPKFATQNLRLA